MSALIAAARGDDTQHDTRTGPAEQLAAVLPVIADLVCPRPSR